MSTVIRVAYDDQTKLFLFSLVRTYSTPPQETVASSKSKKRRDKAKLNREREAQIRESEARKLEDDAAPASVEDFEKLVLSNPNSSYIWIRYAAFLLSLSEIEKARAIFERALSTVHFREEVEKLNLWVAYLNFENMHGDPPGPEAVLRVFQRAIKVRRSKQYIYIFSCLIPYTCRLSTSFSVE